MDFFVEWPFKKISASSDCSPCLCSCNGSLFLIICDGYLCVQVVLAEKRLEKLLRSIPLLHLQSSS